MDLTFEPQAGWDGVGIATRRHAETGARIRIAIHSERLGPASGGTRMAVYPDGAAAALDAMRLAAGMTYKWAAADFPRGGGKAVIEIPFDLDSRSRGRILRWYGTILSELAGRFWTGADVGTSSKDMDVVAESGAPYVFSRTPAQGGAGDSGPWTAMGVFSAIEAVCGRLFGERSPRGRRVLVQGAGSVGGALIERLAAAGAAVSFTELDPNAVARLRERGLAFVPADAVWGTPCDLLAPCALGAVLNAESIPRLDCRAVVGAANNQLAGPGDADALRARGILYAPDFVVNAGGAIAITGQESLGWTPARAREEVLRIGATLERVFALAENENLSTDAAARRIADRRLAEGPRPPVPRDPIP